MAVVGRIARPHGLKGHVVVNPETDFVEERFKAGAVLWTRSGAGVDRQLTIESARIQGGRPVIALTGFSRLEDIEPLVGQELRVPEEELQPLEPGQYYEHQLVGCSVERLSGEPVGTVIRVEGGTGGSRLIVDGAGGEIQLPLAAAICVEIDVVGKRIRIDPPAGLLELNEVRHRHDLSADGGGRARGGRGQSRH
jgi:16S rRNA processing protein RimM